METPPLNGWDYTLDCHRPFPPLAVQHEVTWVPFLLEGVALNPDLNGADGDSPERGRHPGSPIRCGRTLGAPITASIGSQQTPTRGIA